MALAATILALINTPESRQPAQSTASGVHRIPEPAADLHHPQPVPAPPAQGEKDQQEIARLKQEQAGLRKRLDQLQQNVKAFQAGSPSQDSADSGQNALKPASDPVAESPEAQEERVNAGLMAQTALLEGTLESEAPDPGWSSEAASALKEKARQHPDIHVEILDVTCRSSLCRMEIAFQPGEHENSLLYLPELVPWSGEMFFRVEDVGTGEAVVFIARENHSLPRIAN
jgi:hypothetical protein